MAIDSFDIEFHAIFDRVSKVVDLKGAYSAAAINRRLEQYFLVLEDERLKRIAQGRRVPNRILSDQEQMLKLLKRNRFASRVIAELIANPEGKVALTIRYGRKRAKEILLRRARERHGRMRIIRDKDVEKFLRRKRRRR
ncbi:hypothetical protein CW705_04005 [Candidatus Bathyarchaeota archaeon]|nr:MAG: hypothetical protein CW705_04005 [Candidatus Bathyarchaeota archaeon]